MERMSETLVEALRQVGGLLDLEAALEDIRKSRKDRHLEFAVLSAEFFALSPPKRGCKYLGG